MRRSTILYLIASAAVAYFYGFPTNGLSHFDEGQYAFARVWPWIDAFDVDQAFFSPPLYPFLVGLVQQFPIARPDLAGVYISWAACWASLYFAVKLAVAWWGRSAALPAFVLLLFSPMRLAFGTIGLTDALFSALLLATLWCATNAFRLGSTRWTIATGLLAGLTWNCKYNGFVALAIIAGFLLYHRSLSSLLRFAVVVLIAGAMIAPWFWAIHAHHPDGLAALQKHQQGYLRGCEPRLVWESLCKVVDLRSIVPGFGTLLVGWLLVGAAPFAGGRWLVAVIVALLIVAEDVSTSRIFPMLSVGVLPCALLSARRAARAPIALAVALVAFLPGIYTPYLRLWLPAEHLLLIVIAGAAASACRYVRSTKPNRPIIAIVALLLFVPSFFRVMGAAATILRISVPHSLYITGSTFLRERPRMPRIDGYWNTSQELVDRANAPEVRRLIVYARPPLLYYLATSRLRTPAQRMPDEFLRPRQLAVGNLIVADVAVRDSIHFADSLREARRRSTLRRIASFDVNPHPLTVLDDFGGVYPPRWGDYNVNLFVVHPPNESNP